jgi:hypothetical protein
MSAPLAGKMAGGNKGEKFLCEMSLGEIGALFSQKTLATERQPNAPFPVY